MAFNKKNLYIEDKEPYEYEKSDAVFKVPTDEVYVIPNEIIKELVEESLLIMKRYLVDCQYKELKSKNFFDLNYDFNINYL